MDNANLVKQLKEAVDILDQIGEDTGVSTIKIWCAEKRIKEVIKELELGIDDGK